MIAYETEDGGTSLAPVKVHSFYQAQAGSGGRDVMMEFEYYFKSSDPELKGSVLTSAPPPLILI